MEWREAEFSETFVAERLNILTEENRFLRTFVHTETKPNKKRMESFAEQHIKLMIASAIVLFTRESDDHGICSLWWLYQILYSF